MLRASGGGWPDPVKYYRSFSGSDQIYVDDKSFTTTLTFVLQSGRFGRVERFGGIFFQLLKPPPLPPSPSSPPFLLLDAIDEVPPPHHVAAVGGAAFILAALIFWGWVGVGCPHWCGVRTGVVSAHIVIAHKWLDASGYSRRDTLTSKCPTKCPSSQHS